ncbi:MAG: DUF2628 domain-containing protein [bacterium]|nr:DUF2628 domain-containing protein [bacterium]
MIDEIVSFESLNVDESWKARFRLIQQYYENKTMSNKDRVRINKEIFFKNGGIGTFIAAYIFSTFYYLFKGMWLKAIVYTLIAIFMYEIITHLIPALTNCTIAYSVIFAILAPYDYYRLKVLKKQW